MPLNFNLLMAEGLGNFTTLISDLKARQQGRPADQPVIFEQIRDEAVEHYKRCMGNRPNKSPMDTQGAVLLIRGGLEILLKHLSEVETLVEDKQ